MDVQLWTDSSTSRWQSVTCSLPQNSPLLWNDCELEAWFHDCRAVALDATNEQAWCHGRILKVGASIYSVIVNPPTVDKVGSSIPTIGRNQVLVLHGYQRRDIQNLSSAFTALHYSITMLTDTAIPVQIVIHGQAVVGIPVCPLPSVSN